MSLKWERFRGGVVGSYPGVGVVEHDEDDEDVGPPGGLHGAGHPFLPLQEEAAPVRHDDQQLGRLWRSEVTGSEGQRSVVSVVEGEISQPPFSSLPF